MKRSNISYWPGLATTFLVAALIAFAMTAASASAALVADYRFDGDLTSSVGSAPPLTEVGAGGATFQTETVNGSSDGVRVFPAGAGLSLATAGLVTPGTYTVEITFRFNETTTWERIFDATNASADNGLYVKNSKLTYYDNHHVGSPDHFGTSTVLSGEYLTVALSRSPDGTITVYRDGVPEITYADSSNTGVFQSPGFPARFFIDDNIVGGENSPGAVARIRVFDNDTPVAPPADGRNGTVTKVQCNYVVATGVDICFAQVADSKPGSAKRPTGTVKFSSGNGGSFFSGNRCELVPTPASPNVSSCSVQYLSPKSSFPKVAAAYQGSAHHAPSTGETTFYVLGGNGFAVDLGPDPSLGKKSSSPMTVGCNAGTAKKSATVEVAFMSYECMMAFGAAYEEAKNKAIGKPCPDKLKSYSDLKNCNPRYREALEEWERQEEEEFGKLADMVQKRQDKFEELKDIIDDYNKSAKGIINRARSVAPPFGKPFLAKTRRVKPVSFGRAHAVTKGRKQKTVRLKLTQQAQPFLTFVRRMNKALPALDLTINVTLKVEATTRRTKKTKPKRKVVKRVVAYSVTP